MRAFVLVKVSVKKHMDFTRALQDVEGVVEASVIHGPYDSIVSIEGKRLENVNATVMAIRELPGVRETMTCLVTQSWHRTEKE
jgi:DNA-binding Lrp family transcriptional regulator